MKPVMNKREDIEDMINSATERTAKKIFDTVIDTGAGTEGKKLSEVLKDIKDKPPEQKNEGAHKHDDDIDCPTCHKGHIHALKKEEGVYKCTGPECGKKFHLVSTTPEFQCINCGTPIDKPAKKELEDTYVCPTCGRDHFKEFDTRKFKKMKT